jgi:Family of unknown function (DUF6188)
LFHVHGTDFSGAGPWELSVCGFEVDTLWFTYPFVIVAHGDGGKHLKVSLGGPFDYGDAAGQSFHLNAETDRWEDLAPLLALRSDKVARASASTETVLRIEFDSGRSITAAPSADHENWEALGPGFFIVGAPTPGEPTIWTGKSWEQ